MASPFHQPYLPPGINPYAPTNPLAAPVLPPAIKHETPPIELALHNIPPAEPILPSPDAASLSANEGGPGASSASVKKKVARAGHGVGAGGGGASTYKNKPLMWVPPPTYPYNLIPGRDLYADVIPPRPTEAEQVAGSGWYKVPFSDEQEPGPSNEVKKKKKPSGKKKSQKGEDGEEDGWEDEDDFPEAGVSSIGGEGLHDPEGAVKKKKPKSDANKAKLQDQEKEEKDREKAEKAAARAEKAGQKAKASGPTSASATKGKATGSSSKGKSVAFTANQGVRVEGARNAIREDVEEEEEPEEELEIDTRLYCVCKQMYDDDRIMIACDNCDDWCHPGCVGLPESDLDLVDLFFCPNCTASHLNLRTTYKTACAQEGCRRPARLPLSKFCSDECGIECVMKRVDKWCMEIDPPPPPPVVDNALAVPASRSRSKGKTKTPSPVVTPPPPEPSEATKAALAKLEATSVIRLAKRREGLVSVEGDSSTDGVGPSLSTSGRKLEEERMLSRYRESLTDIKTEWAVKVRALAAAQARLVMLDVAMQRSEWLDFSSEGSGKCGFDERLVMDEEEWAEWVESEEGRRAFEGYGIGDESEAVEVDQADKAKELETIENVVCVKRKKCERHGGWQKLKKADFELEQRLLDESLQKLKAREQDLRSRIADIETLRTPPDTVSRRPLGSLVVNPHSPTGTSAPVQVIVVAPSSPMQVDDRRSSIVQNLDALGIGADMADADVDMAKDPGDSQQPDGLGDHSAFINEPTSSLNERLQAALASGAEVAVEVPFTALVGFDSNDTEMQDIEVDVLG